jgi:hypothetical protein
MTTQGESVVRTAATLDWSMVSVVVLRQAGFSVELLDAFVQLEAWDEVSALLDSHARVRALAGPAKRLLREVDVAGKHGMASTIGQYRPLRHEPDRALASLHGYQQAAVELAERWTTFRAAHEKRLNQARIAAVTKFADPRLRDVLLLSNDANYAEFAAWLDTFDGRVNGHTKRMTDLLVMYLQRVATKNETHSHFGPFTVGRSDPASRGVSWSAGHEVRRRVFASHWAVEKLAEVFTADPGLADWVRPRRRPLAFLRDGRIDLFAFTTEGALSVDWRFQHVGGGRTDEREQWLWKQCDGARTVGELRDAWRRRFPDNHAGEPFDAVLRQLVDHDWLVAKFEVPVGDPYPLRALRDQLRKVTDPAAEAALTAVESLDRGLAEFAVTPPESRAARLAEVKSRFEELTGCAPNRFGGLHYADRSVLFEEAHSELRDLAVGQDLVDFIISELSVVYESVLVGPRLRMRRETTILTRWFDYRFGPNTVVELDRFYGAFFADRDGLTEECAAVDAELDELDGAITDTLLGDWDGTSGEVVLDPRRVRAVFAEHPAEPLGLCNPDILFAARDRDALARGDFLAVIGDCHSVRDVLTHTCFSPLVQERAPELLPETHHAYLGMLDDGEVLVDLARDHPDKAATQLAYPCLDLEVFGRSPKPRDQVIQPSQLYLVLRGGRLELRAEGVGGRLRLMAPPAGGPSIWQDPLSPFAFPRHFGGVGLRADRYPNVPRIRIGRVVLQRQLWRVPSARLRGWSIPGDPVLADDAADFVAACQLRAEFRMPRHTFVTIPGEPKPVYLDWHAPLLVRQVFRLARRTEGIVEFSEMLPTPDQRWLEVRDQRFTTELRCTVFNRRSRS